MTSLGYADRARDMAANASGARIADCPRGVLHSSQSVTLIRRRQNTPPETAGSGGLQGARAVFTLFLAPLCAVSMAAQAPKIDTSRIGPRVGQKVPDFAGTDQLGRKQTLASSLGAKGAMLTGASTGPHQGSGSRNRMSQSNKVRGQPVISRRKT